MRIHTASVMIVDDNEVDRYLLRRGLNRVKPRPLIFEVKNGEQAVAFFSENSSSRDTESEYEVDDTYRSPLIFLDINMPRMNGLDFLREFAVLRERNEHINSSVIMCSTARIEDEVERAMAFDFVKGYFEKGDVNDGVLSALVAQYGSPNRDSDQHTVVSALP